MKTLYTLTFLLLFASFSSAQFERYPRENEGELRGGAGLNWIDGDLYYSFNFRPEISFVNFGVGLDLKLDFNENGALRKENFNEFSDYLSIIRYVRYGFKNDPLYVKLGALDYYTLGHGSIMYRYNNSPGFDARKIGLITDIDFGMAGFETLYSRFAEAGVIGVRGYTRPFRFTSLGNIPIIKNIETGISFAGDFHSHAGVTSGSYNPASQTVTVNEDKGSVNIIGADIGIPFPLTDLFNMEFYIDYTSILNFGHGAAAGVIFNFDGLGITDAFGRFERRFNGKNYIPSYFNSLYEIERFKIIPETSTVETKAALLNSIPPVNGYFGEAGIRILNTFEILAAYQSLDKSPKNGVLHLTAIVEPETFPFVARAGYDKINIDDGSVIFRLDDNSYLYSEIGYKPLPYLIFSLLYSWTYTPLRDSDKDIIGYETQKRIEPRIYFIYPFRFDG